jgi:hypothetical protein
LLKAVQSRRVDLVIQAGGRPAVSGKEAKKSSQRGNIMLETSPAQACTSIGYIRFDIAGPNGFHGSARFF